jgi:uncharacterized protein YjiS (DUF1127 family)
MSSCTPQVMTNHHVKRAWAGLLETVQLWRRRYRTRQELARWSDRELHDVGMSWSEVVREIEKPFWRA